MNGKTFQASATLIGTVIGAGIFGVPFVIAKIGFIPGSLYLLILGFFVLLLNLAYGQVVFHTPGDHQLTGYAQIYLGKPGKILAAGAIFISCYGALLAYLIKTGEFLALIFNSQNSLFFSLSFFIIASAALFFGLKTISFLEGLLVTLLLGLILFIAIFSFGKINPAHFTAFDSHYLFLPFGVILFALFGTSAIPEMEEILRRKRQNLFKAIIIGSLIPVFVYFLFSFVIIGISGPQTSDDAISGLTAFLPSWIVNLSAFLGVITMSTSYLTLGYALREVYFRDFKFSRNQAFFSAVFPPLIIFLSGAKSFISVLELTGIFTAVLQGILIVSLFFKTNQRL